MGRKLEQSYLAGTDQAQGRLTGCWSVGKAYTAASVIHTGYDAWDPEGRFYFASFNGQPNQPVVLTRVDPTRLKAALVMP
jgi:hypothetical protein